jgi:hypothetical protein
MDNVCLYICLAFGAGLLMGDGCIYVYLLLLNFNGS